MSSSRTPSGPTQSSPSRTSGKSLDPTVSRRRALAAGTSLLGTLALSPVHTSGAPVLRAPGDSAVKQQAREDYQNSLARYGGWMSNPIEQLLQPARRQRPTDMDIAIIGSGYGGAICAGRLAQQRAPGTRVCVLERGREWRPGDFPDSVDQAVRANRLSFLSPQANAITSPNELINFYRSDDFNVITASGLGGTSLINAGVAVRPDREVFAQSRWPKNLRYREVLDPFFHASAVELGVLPNRLTDTPRLVAQRQAIARMASSDKQFYAANLAVTFDQRFLDHHGRNRQGMVQRPCTACGDCMSGCNVGAKNSVQMNYMPLAKRHGVEIYTQTEVQWIETIDQGYRLHLVFHRGHGDQVESTPFTKTTRIAIVAGGSPGSTAIMMRSRRNGLAVSDALGKHWSGNGDTLGFITGTTHVTKSGGVGAYSANRNEIGPAIQTIARMHSRRAVQERFLLQDGAMPRAYAGVVGMLMGDIDLDHVMVIFGMGHDGSDGKIVMRNDTPQIQWPGVNNSPYRTKLRKALKELATAHGGKDQYLQLFGDNMVSVHPLGGCNMSDDPAHGVVNDVGQVYHGQTAHPADTSSASMVYSGLYVADGSIIPGSLGANPLWTISALSERIAASIAMDPAHRDLFREA